MKLIFLILICMICIRLNAQIINIPDPKFKALLVSSQVATGVNGNVFSIDANGDGEIQVSEAQSVYSIYLWPNPDTTISDLTGIEGFTNLRTLMIKEHLVTVFDMTSNTNLLVLESISNPVSSINVSTNMLLDRLTCKDCQLTTIDVSNNISLRELNLSGNQLTTIDVTHNINLEALLVSDNQLTSLDVSQNVKLQGLMFWNNMLTELDLIHNPELRILYCRDNSLTSIDLSNNPEMDFLICPNNPLESLNIKNGSQLDILIFSDIPNLQYVCADDFEYQQVQDLISEYGYQNVLVDDVCIVLRTITLNTEFFEMYPNPATTKLVIKNLFEGSQVRITDVLGKVVYQSYDQQGILIIDIENFKRGVYLITVEDSSGVSNCQKLIVDSPF